MNNKKFLKVMFGTTSGANNTLEYKIDEVNIANNWNPTAKNSKDMGGFNFSTEDKILRWLVRGDTLYDVIIPNDAEVIDCPSESAPHGVFRTNKIILSNPRKMTDEIALELYKKSNLPEKPYYKSLAGLAIRGYKNTAVELIKDKINKENIKLVISEINDFIKPDTVSNPSENTNEVYNEIMEYLNEIDNDLLISRFIDKEPYIKEISNHKIINITGESGSGKSYFSKEYIDNDNYIVIDTDEVFSKFENSSAINKELGIMFRNKYEKLPNIFEDFDLIYKDILNYFKESDKTIVIDSAQFRNIKDYSLLKGKVIIMRTSINTCYERCINRWILNHKNHTKDELDKYKNKKYGMFSWYKALNKFLKEIEKL